MAEAIKILLLGSIPGIAFGAELLTPLSQQDKPGKPNHAACHFLHCSLFPCRLVKVFQLLLCSLQNSGDFSFALMVTVCPSRGPECRFN
jgi:hypothetical protein